jgi:uncharacterized membrane protein YqjE
MNAPSRPSTQLPPDGAQPSLGAVLGDVTRDMSQLVRQEVELAKVELRQEAKRTGQTAGLFGAAGLAGVMVLLFLSFALWWGLANVMDQGWAALIVAGVWLVAAAILLAVARSRMRQIRGPQQTSQTVRQIPDALKGQSQP